MTDRQHPAAVLMLGAPLPPPYGGIATYLQRTVPHLASLGHRLHLIQSGKQPEVDEQSDGASWESVTTEPFNIPSAASRRLFLIKNLASLMPFLLRYQRPMRTDKAYAKQQLNYFLSWCMLADRAGKKAKPDVIHAFDLPWLQGAAAVWAARRFKARGVVSTFGEILPHQDELTQIDASSRAYRSLSRYVLEHAHVVTSMTDHCRDQVRHAGFKPSRVAKLRFVVGMRRFEDVGYDADLRNELAPEGGPVLLFVGQIRERKGPHVAVDALASILESYPTARLIVVGPDHGFGGELIERAARHGVADAISLTGMVSDDQLPSYYGACDLFIFPTITAIECLGLTFVQAMFARKPVIATRIAGAPEVIDHDVTGFLVDPGDAEALASETLRVLRMDSTRRSEIGRLGFERVRALFNEEAVLADIVNLYRGEVPAGRQA